MRRLPADRGQDRQQPGLFTPGYATAKSNAVVVIGMVIAVVGGLHDHDKQVLGAGIGIVICGGIMDLFARRGNGQVKNFIASGLIVAAILTWQHPHLMYEWMTHLAAESNSFLAGGH